MLCLLGGVAPRAGAHASSALFREKSSTIATPSEFFLRAPLLDGILGVIKRHPFISQNALCSLKMIACDIMVQTQIEGQILDNLDKRRTAVFASFGALYQGGIQYFIYTKVFPRLFDAKLVNKFCNQSLKQKLRNKEGIKAMLKQNLTDMCVNQPFLYFPIFYIVKEGTTAADEVGTGATGPYGSVSSFSGIPMREVVSNALDKYRPNIVSDVGTMSMFWFPANLVAYSIPIHFRLPTIHLFSLGWGSYLSLSKGAREIPQGVEGFRDGVEDFGQGMPVPQHVAKRSTHQRRSYTLGERGEVLGEL